DSSVTGVQTYALPIFCTIGFSSEISNHLHRPRLRKRPERDCWTFIVTTRGHYPDFSTEISLIGSVRATEDYQRIGILCSSLAGQIGRASCRERVEVSG